MTATKKRWGKVYIKKPRSEGGHHPDKKKLEVAATFLACGNWSMTAKLCDVPLQTIVYWRKQPWFEEMQRDLRTAEKVETSNKLQKARNKALEVVTDRLEHGNYQYDPKTGALVRVPVNARDAHKIASDFLQQEELLEVRIDALQKKEEIRTKDILADLAKRFEDFAKGEVKKEQEKTIDVEDAQIVQE